MTAQLIAAGVENNIGVITSHSYTSNPSSPLVTTQKVWQTENADLNDAFNPNNWYSNGGAGEGMVWAQKIYTALVAANCSAYLYWEGAYHIGYYRRRRLSIRRGRDWNHRLYPLSLSITQHRLRLHRNASGRSRNCLGTFGLVRFVLEHLVLALVSNSLHSRIQTTRSPYKSST